MRQPNSLAVADPTNIDKVFQSLDEIITESVVGIQDSLIRTLNEKTRQMREHLQLKLQEVHQIESEMKTKENDLQSRLQELE